MPTGDCHEFSGFFPRRGSWREGCGCLAFSPDGRVLASGGNPFIHSPWCNHTVRLWSVPDRKLLTTLAGPKGEVRCFAFSRDGEILAIAGWDGRVRTTYRYTVRLWRVRNGELLKSLPEHDWPIVRLAFSPKKPVVAIGCADAVRLWTVPDGELLKTLPDGATCLVFSPDGCMLAGSRAYSPTHLWGVPDGEALKSIQHTYRHTSCVAISPDGRIRGGQEVTLWGLPDGDPLGTLTGHQTWLPVDELDDNPGSKRSGLFR
jgi:WD40 repeat protein